MVQNKALIFKTVPVGSIKIPDNIQVEAREFDDSAAPPSGAIITQNLWLSYDPYLRGHMREATIKSYAPAFEIGQPLDNFGIAKVLKSANPDFKEGDTVRGVLHFEQYSLITEQMLKSGGLPGAEEPTQSQPGRVRRRFGHARIDGLLQSF